MSGRITPGVGVRIDAKPESGINADNYNPVSANKKQTLTFAGTPTVATRRTYSGNVTNAGTTGNKAGLVLDTGTYEAESTPGMTTAQLAAAVALACTLGTYDKWVVEYTGGPSIVGGETCSITINGTTYSYVTSAFDTISSVATGIAAAAAADPLYNVVHIGASGKCSVTAKSRGFTHAVSNAAAAPFGVAAATHSITGLAANTTWGVYVPAGSTVTAEHAVAGTTAATVTATVTGTVAFTCPLTIEGYPDDIVRVMSGTHTYSHTAVFGDTNISCATAIAAAMNGVDGFTCTVTAPGVCTVTRTDYTTFSFSDTTVKPNPSSTIAITPATTQALNPPLSSTSGTNLVASRNGVGTVEFILTAGTSFKAYLWWYDTAMGLWILDGGFGTKTIVGDIIYPFTTGGSRAFIQCDTFVGGATADIYIHTAG